MTRQCCGIYACTVRPLDSFVFREYQDIIYALYRPAEAGRVHMLMVNSRVGLRRILGYCLVWLRHVRLFS